MKVAFRQQASNYDCVPTTFMNALTYLFDRREIPPFVIQRIYRECLDVEASRGTSGQAVRDLGFWLSNYKEKSFSKFAVESKFITGEQVHLRQRSKILRCLNDDGAALLSVYAGDQSLHYILAFKCEDGWLYCYDPYPRAKKLVVNESVQFIDSNGQQEPNLKIRCDWIDKDMKKAKKPDDRKFILGDNDDRECLLLNRLDV